MTLRPEILLTFLGMCAVTFGSRYLGLSLRGQLPAFWLRFLRFVPVAVFTSLVVPEIQGTRGEGTIRIVAAILAGLVAWRTKQLWLTMVVGMVVFWLLRLLNVG